MKFAEDIKLEGVVNTNEDSRAVRRELGEEPWQEARGWQESPGRGRASPGR